MNLGLGRSYYVMPDLKYCHMVIEIWMSMLLVGRLSPGVAGLTRRSRLAVLVALSRPR